MADTAVEFLLTKISSLAEEKLRLLSSVRQDIWHIENRLQQWQALIRGAEAAINHDEELQVWIKQVREVVYEAEDVFDEVRVRLPPYQGRGFKGYIHKNYKSAMTLRTRDKLASKIQEIVPKITAIDSKEQIYRDKIELLKRRIASAEERLDDGREAALLVERHDLVGIDQPIQQLIDLMQMVNGGSGLKVISVNGAGGLGKSTLVKQVYDEVKQTRHFNTCAFLKVSNSCVIDRLLRDMIQQLYQEAQEDLPHGFQTMDSISLKSTVKSFLSRNTFMLVFDDIWSSNVWEAIRPALPTSSYGRVMVTTRNADLASCCCNAFGGGHDFELGYLSKEDAMTLFCRRVFKADNCPPEFEELSRCFLQRCEGLPLAIEAISNILTAKDQLTTEAWNMVLRSLGAEIESSDKFKQMKMVFLHSHDDLEYRLKFCAMYLSIFQENYLIEYRRLLRLWMAEGFIRETEGKTCEEVAEAYFNELFNKNLVQVTERTSDGRVKRFRIRHFLREIYIQKSKDQNFAEIHREHTIRRPSIIRRLSVHDTPQNMQSRKMNVSRLRSLLMSRAKDPLSRSFMSELFSTNLTMLTVLDLQGAAITKFPMDVFALIHLKYISMRSTGVEKIPTAIKKLQNLQTLDLKDTNIRELPNEISKLQLLQYLLVYRYELESYPQFHYKQGFKSPANIGDLQSLEKLSCVEADQSKDKDSVLVQLGRLTQLRKLSITKLKKEHSQALCNLFQCLKNLRSFSVTSIGENDIIDLQNIDASSISKHLRQLYLIGGLESAPHWIASLSELTRIHLKWSRLTVDPLKYLQDLPNLSHLELLQAFNGDTLIFMAGKFEKLKFLGIDNFDKLKKVVLLNSMPNLEKLIIQRCPLLEDIPSGIEGLNNLKVMEFFDMPDAFIDRLRQGHPGAIHIPNVSSSKWAKGLWTKEVLRELQSSAQPSYITSDQEMKHCWK